MNTIITIFGTIVGVILVVTYTALMFTIGA